MEGIVNMLKNIIVLMFVLFSSASFAIPFTITPKGKLPTEVPRGLDETATYIVKNNTSSQRNNNYVKYLPPNVTVAPTGCSKKFNLAPGASCELNLLVSGAVDAYDPDPHNHLFVCFQGGISCAGLEIKNSLNVTVIEPQWVFVANQNNPTLLAENNSISKCIFHNNKFSHYSSTGSGFNMPTVIALNNAGTKAYITNFMDAGISLCDISSKDSSLMNCSKTGDGSLAMTSFGVSLNPAGDKAYVTNMFGASVSLCDVSGVTGELSNCHGTGGYTTFSFGSHIFLTSSRAYISAIAFDPYWVCDIESDGELSGCIERSTGASVSASGIIINSNETKAYLAATDGVYTCDIDSDDGTLIDCTLADATYSLLDAIVLNKDETYTNLVKKSY